MSILGVAPCLRPLARLVIEFRASRKRLLNQLVAWIKSGEGLVGTSTPRQTQAKDSAPQAAASPAAAAAPASTGAASSVAAAAVPAENSLEELADVFNAWFAAGKGCWLLPIAKSTSRQI